ncbi:Protein ZGRF1 [Purpureocillium lavendulum]|uniref:Protein ZGRF1 n=1 Tax=Purpureocillium lavendulum TaxID=1247861 RepID=A0AB34FTH7_9HYPO|nr:Protein ZGRF1 [Purpureocillium lavendulum]
MAAFEALLCEAGVPFRTQGSADFNELLSNYSGNHLDGKPAIITVPETEQHVAAIVSGCVASNMEFVVRGGGHDAFGRSTVANGVTIDLRRLSSVTVSHDLKSACIGGGATSVQVLAALAPKGLQVPFGTCGAVGYAGWCLVAGFGPLMHSYGIGTDQIVGARVVTAEGKVVRADHDMLKGLRGGGANLGVVVELTTKVYHLEKIQAGMLMFESTDIESTVKTFFTNYAKLFTPDMTLPRKMYTMPVIVTPSGSKPTLCCFIVYNGTANDESRTWIDRIAGLAALMPGTPPAEAAITPTSALDFTRLLMEKFENMKRLNGRSQAASVARWSPEVITTLAQRATHIPPGSTAGILVQQMRADCPSVGSEVPESICPYRQPQIALEVLGTGPPGDVATSAMAWALDTRNKLMELPDAMKSTYVATTSPECLNVPDTFGDNLQELKRLKRKYDPNGIFKNTIPRLAD